MRFRGEDEGPATWSTLRQERRGEPDDPRLLPTEGLEGRLLGCDRVAVYPPVEGCLFGCHRMTQGDRSSSQTRRSTWHA